MGLGIYFLVSAIFKIVFKTEAQGLQHLIVTVRGNLRERKIGFCSHLILGFWFSQFGGWKLTFLVLVFVCFGRCQFNSEFYLFLPIFLLLSQNATSFTVESNMKYLISQVTYQNLKPGFIFLSQSFNLMEIQSTEYSKLC